MNLKIAYLLVRVLRVIDSINLPIRRPIPTPVVAPFDTLSDDTVKCCVAVPECLVWIRPCNIQSYGADIEGSNGVVARWKPI
jgi:hypothetical protein